MYGSASTRADRRTEAVRANRRLAQDEVVAAFLTGESASDSDPRTVVGASWKDLAYLPSPPVLAIVLAVADTVVAASHIALGVY
jgi:hypothetical protein